MSKMIQIRFLYLFCLILLQIHVKAMTALPHGACTDTFKTVYKPEVLSSGFIDIINNGQVNASARLIRIFIGEPGKMSIPISVYSGVSSNNFQNKQSPLLLKSNEQLVSNFINPLSGLANIAIDGIRFFKRKGINMTKAGWIYHLGDRVLTGFKTGPASDPTTGRPINFLNSTGFAGIYFQTGAWEKNNTGNMGVCWLTFRYIACFTRPGQLKEILGGVHVKGFYHGWSLGWGVEINNLVSIKVLYYKYVSAPETGFSSPVYQFSFNYSLK